MSAAELIVPRWPASANVRACTTTRHGGVSENKYASLNLAAHVGDGIDRVLENRSRLRQKAGLKREPHWLEQVHGNRVADLSGNDPGVTADASVCARPGPVCAVLTADCLPILLADRAGGQVAAVHAGWRGLAGGIIEATLAKMSAGNQDLIAWLGPAIGPQAYQVGADVRDAFLVKDPQDDRFFSEDDKLYWKADLCGLARNLFESFQVEVFGGDLCTYSDAERFFSYRRDGQCGRQATLIWLES